MSQKPEEEELKKEVKQRRDAAAFVSVRFTGRGENLSLFLVFSARIKLQTSQDVFRKE